MTSTQELYLQALALPAEARAELSDPLVASLGQGIDPKVEQAHLVEVRRRIAQVEAGTVRLVRADKALSRLRNAARRKARSR
jgi:hypothetical protein